MKKKVQNRYFSATLASDEITIKVQGENSGKELWAELKKCVQKWNRRKKYHGGSKVGYCIELKTQTEEVGTIS